MVADATEKKTCVKQLAQQCFKSCKLKTQVNVPSSKLAYSAMWHKLIVQIWHQTVPQIRTNLLFTALTSLQPNDSLIKSSFISPLFDEQFVLTLKGKDLNLNDYSEC